MNKYHAVLSFCGSEFSVGFKAQSDTAALCYLDDNYPESSVTEFGDSNYWRQKRADLYNRLESEMY